jgi:hypothetical protein
MLIPYLYLADNSLLLLILFGLFTTIANNISTDIDIPPKPHKFINSPLQSSFFITKKLLSYLKSDLVIAEAGLSNGITFLYNKVNIYKTL